jgi:protein-disulfide isomerase
VLEKYPNDVKLVMKHFPLPSHPFARKAAIAALAAGKQGKFWEIHERLFAVQSDLNDGKFETIAKEIGLDLEKFNRDLQDPGAGSLIDGDINNGVKANIPGTPAIFVNGKLLKQRSLPGFQQVIEAELKRRQ